VNARPPGGIVGDPVDSPLQSAQQMLAPLARALRTKCFICGCGHSGTSIMARVLASHPQTHVPRRETAAFLREKFVPTVRPDALDGARQLLQDAVASGRPVLVEKTPSHIHSLALIRTLLPGARFILPVRDGRDVAASIALRTGDAPLGIRRWVDETARVQAAAACPDVLVYRYEDFVTDAEATVRRVCEFLGLAYTSALLAYHRETQTWFDVPTMERGDGRSPEEHRKLRNWQVNQPLFDGRGRWRSELAPEHVAAFDHGPARQLMLAFGYT